MKIFSLVLMLTCISTYSHAETVLPDDLIRETAREVLEVINHEKSDKDANQKKLLEIIDSKVLPHFNFERMTKLAVGRSWRIANAEQKASLIVEFRTLLVRTYSRAFTLYNNVSVDTKPVMVPANADEVTVKTIILRPGAPPIPVNYEMEKTENGWKVFDVIVEGISLVATHRNSFAEKVQQSGVDGLIASLTELNKDALVSEVKKADSK